MKPLTKRMFSFALIIVMVASLSVSAFADSYGNRDLVWLFDFGGSITIPGDFQYNESERSQYEYNFYNERLNMLISVEEDNYDGDYRRFSVLNEAYDYYIQNYPRPVYNVKSNNDFTLSGYNSDNIYYIHYIMDHNVMYSVFFLYPTRNRSICDPIVERVERSLNTGISYWGYNPTGKPSRADLDLIHADVKYPNYEFMYLDHYISTYVTHNAVYCFKDPDNDIWRKGNYFTVTYGTKVTILAESQGYACVILDDTLQAGWINCDYLKNH